MIDTLVNALQPGAAFLIDATVKTTVFLGLVLFVVWLLGTRQSAKRSLLLSWCFVGLLVIPVASLSMPSLQWDSPAPRSDAALPDVQPVVAPEASLVQSDELMQQQVSASQVFERPDGFALRSPAEVVFAPNASGKAVDWTAWILCVAAAVYAAGSLVLSLRLIHCLMRVRKFRKSLLPCDDERLWGDFQVLKKQLGIRRSVVLALSDQTGSPTQIGSLKPVVVLPAPIAKSPELLKSILVHELVHVKRWDCLYRLVAMVGMVFYWFNPLFHRASRLLSEAQEQVCDDWTVTATGRYDVYANALLNVATQLRPRPTMALGMDMARTAQVMARVERVITLGGQVTPRVGRVSALALAAVFVAGSMAIGSLTAGKAQPPQDPIAVEGGVAVADTSDIARRELPMKMRDGRLWWRGKTGLYLQDGDSWQKFTLPEGGAFDALFDFMQARDGSVWFVGRYKNRPVVAHFTGKTWHLWDSINGLGDHEVGINAHIAEDSDGGIWIRKVNDLITERGGNDRVAGGKGVLRFDGKTWHNYTVADGLIHNRVYDIEPDPHGGVWIATLRGLSHYKNGKWTSHIVDRAPVAGVRNANVHEGRKTYDLFYDKEGTLWAVHGSIIGRTITRDRGGISSFDGRTSTRDDVPVWTHYNAHQGLPIFAFRDVNQTANGDLWFGTHLDDQQDVESRGLVRYRDGRWLRFTRRHGLPGDFVCICGMVEKGDGSFYARFSRSDEVLYRPPTDSLASISGRVIGQTAPSMGIWVEYDDGEVHAGTATDEAGTYRVEVTPGAYRVRIASLNAADPVPVEAKPGARIKGIDLQLQKSRRISGRVLDPFENPIPNAVVVISDNASQDKRLSPQVAVTDGSGRYEAWRVAGSPTTFEVAAKGYAQTHLDLDRRDFMQDVMGQKTVPNGVQYNLHLSKGTTLRGRVVDEAGQPIAWVRVGLGPEVDPEKKSMPFQRNAYTDEAGLFALDDVDEKGGLVWMNHPTIGVVSQNAVPADSAVNIRVKRLRLYSVSGVVSLHKGSAEKFQIMALPHKRPSGSMRPHRTHTDADGAYRLDDLQPGEYQISFGTLEEMERDGRKFRIYRSVQSRRLAIEDRDVTLNFEPLGNARITGVATHDRQPVANVLVHASELDSLNADAAQNALANGTLTDKDGYFDYGTLTDKDGYFDLRDLPNARIVISFFKTPIPGAGSSGGKRYTKTDTLDLTDQRELSYFADLSMEERASLRVGDLAPDIEAKRLDGSTFRLADYRGKKAILIDFWATWCGPCIDELPTIEKIAETYRDQGLEVVGVSFDRNRQTLQNFVEKEKLPYIQVFDKDGEQALRKSYGVWGIPSVFLIDKDGVIRALGLRGTRTEAAVKALLTPEVSPEN